MAFCREFVDHLERGIGFSITAIPKEIYTAPVPPARKHRERNSEHDDDDEQGKTKTKKQKRSGTQFVVELLRPTNGKHIKVSRQLLCHNGGKAPSVKAQGKDKELCLRSCGTLLGKCNKGDDCPNFHFDKQAQTPPEGVDLNAVKQFLANEKIKALLEPTDLGKKVLGL
jgi:hypothetical protein